MIETTVGNVTVATTLGESAGQVMVNGQPFTVNEARDLRNALDKAQQEVHDWSRRSDKWKRGAAAARLIGSLVPNVAAVSQHPADRYEPDLANIFLDMVYGTKRGGHWIAIADDDYKAGFDAEADKIAHELTVGYIAAVRQGDV